ncbi:MAG: hypothetical protein QOD10_1280 [Mycobacterium sp.]|jgi:hypothetical protein|nr:hypothetical protein [Mycobacterium sp.]
MENVTGNDMSSSGPEDRKTPGAAPLLGDLNLESLGELGTSVILIRNLATELVNAVEHVRSAGTSVWNALNLLRYPDSDASAGSSSPLGSVGGLLGGQAAGRGALDDLLDPLGAVGRAAGATDIRPLLNFPTGTTSPPSAQQATESSSSARESASEPGAWNPFSAVTDAVNDVLGGARRQEKQPSASEQSSSQSKSGTATANGDPSSGANGAATDTRESSATATPPPSGADKPPSSVRPPDNLLAAVLGSNPATEVLGRAIGTVTQPVEPVIDQVGEGLRQVATAPWTGVRDVVDKVVGTGARDETDALRKRGNALIRTSYKPELQRRDVHPSFSRILDELLPDEARILRFLAVAGLQPLLDVRTKTLFQVGSVLLAGDVSMVASMAGCHWPDRDHHYFANLERLGLIDLSREPVDDYRRYALLEVQPPALHAIESGEKTITIYRSIALTAFGQQFIEVCTNTEGYNAGGWDTDGRQDRIRGEEKKHA